MGDTNVSFLRQHHIELRIRIKQESMERLLEYALKAEKLCRPHIADKFIEQAIATEQEIALLRKEQEWSYPI